MRDSETEKQLGKSHRYKKQKIEQGAVKSSGKEVKKKEEEEVEEEGVIRKVEVKLWCSAAECY